jgi:hypothetical protein
MKNLLKWSRVIPKMLTISVILMTIMAMIIPAQVVAASTNIKSSPYEAMFRTLKLSFNRQRNQMADMAAYQQRLARSVAVLKHKGVDASTLQNALNKFNYSYYNARSAYYSAKAIFDTHSGYNASGKVINKDMAHMSLLKARSAVSIYITNIKICKRLRETSGRQFYLLNRVE